MERRSQALEHGFGLENSECRVGRLELVKIFKHRFNGVIDHLFRRTGAGHDGRGDGIGLDILVDALVGASLIEMILICVELAGSSIAAEGLPTV